MVAPDPLCNECLFGDWIGYNDPPKSCRYCLSTRERENFVSLYREDPKPAPKQRKKRTRKPRSPPEEVPVHPQRRKDDPERKYKVLYTDPKTGDWFYEISTRDLIGHHKGLRVDDIQDIIE